MMTTDVQHTAARFVLIHSPLCGPLTWGLVAQELRRQGVAVELPAFGDDGTATAAYWQQHVSAIVHALAGVSTDRPLILVAHSGAGPLLPAIGAALPQTIGAYLFADAGLPHPAFSRLDEMAQNVPDIAAGLRASLMTGGRYPTWRDDDLRELIPDARLRAGMVAELQPRALDYFTEPLPTIAGWPDAPCGYLRFSAAYDQAAAEAHRRGWPVHKFAADHFHQLVDPDGVAAALLALSRTLLR